MVIVYYGYSSIMELKNNDQKNKINFFFETISVLDFPIATKKKIDDDDDHEA